MTSSAHAPFEIPQSLATDLDTKLGILLNAGSEAVDLGKSIVESHLVGKSPDSHYKLVSYLIFAKGFKTFQTIQCLCRIGCGVDGLSLCGSLFENVVDLAFISKAPIRRSRRFVEFEQVDKFLQLKKVLGRKRLPRGMRKEFVTYLKTIGPQARGLLKYFPKPYRGWAQRSLYERAATVKMDLDYCNDYWVFCGVKHTLPAGAASFVFQHDQGMDVVLGPSIRGVYHAARYSTDYFLKLCLLFGKAYSLPIDDEIGQVAKRLGEAAVGTHKVHPELCE